MRRVEIGGFGDHELLFSLGARDIKTLNAGQLLASNWLLEPVAGALLEATGQLEERRSSDPFARNQDVSMICYHLRHTAATSLLATLLLPDDCDVHCFGPLTGMVPDLISLQRKRRLVPRLLGKGSAGRQAAHAVARLLGHYDLSTLRSTYAHLMDWSLGVAVRRPAIQPPLSGTALQRLATRKSWRENDLNSDTVRKATQRFHDTIETGPSEKTAATSVLALPEYSLNRRGRPRKEAVHLTSVGYLDNALQSDGRPANRVQKDPDLRLYSCAERWQVVDLVIRAHKSGLNEGEIERNFGIARDDSEVLIRKWSEITNIFQREDLKQEQSEIQQPAFGDIADLNWNNLSDVSFCDLSRNFLSSGFRDLCQALWGAGQKDELVGLRRRQYITQAIMILLTQRNPKYGFYSVKNKDYGGESYRWIVALARAINAKKKNNFVYYKRKNNTINLNLKIDRSVRGKGIKELSVDYAELRRSLLYGIVLYAIDNYDDFGIFSHPDVLTWSLVKNVVNSLKPDKGGVLQRGYIGEVCELSILYKNLELAFLNDAHDATQSFYAGHLENDSVSDIRTNTFLFRILSPTGYTATGSCSKITDQYGKERFTLCGATIPSLNTSRSLERIFVLPEGEVFYKRGGKKNSLILRFPPEQRVLPSVQALLEGRAYYDQQRGCWFVDEGNADFVEAVLFARAISLRKKGATTY